MKSASLSLLIAGCVLVRCIAYSSAANLASQQSAGNATITDAPTDHSIDAEHATDSSQSKDPKMAIASGERADRRRVLDKIRKNRLASPSKTSHPKQVPHNVEHAGPQHVMAARPQDLTKPAGPATKVVKIHTPPVRPTTGVAVSGQQFRNAHSRSATPAVIGGPANTRRSMQAINGTEVSRRHLN